MTTSQQPRPAVPLTPGTPPAAPEHAPRTPRAPLRLLAFPAALSLALASFALLTQRGGLRLTFLGTAGVLLAWTVALYVSAAREKRALAIEYLPRRPHWMQTLAQGTLMGWWAWHTPMVVGFLPFIVAQLLFAYAIESLIAWSRRDTHVLGFGPFPIVISTNFFLVFKPEWFYLQFVMIALGFAAKEFVRWKREGRSTHVFNPSSLPLAVFSIALLLTGTTEMTYGVPIANTIFDTPYIYLAIFLVALPGQLLFGVARTTFAAVLTMYLVSLAYFASTGTYLFYDAHIPAAVFLGMHLLVTDPATSPRSDFGRISFGVLYALLTTVLFVVLERAGAPTFYDKLLPIPLLNLMVRRIDRLATKPSLSWLDPARLFRSLSPARTHVAYAGLYAALFAIMSATQGVGDTHPGQYLPFWHEACGAGSTRACGYAAQLTSVYCQRGSGWACNEVGILRRRLGQGGETEFRRACELGFAAGCTNATTLASAPGALASDHPHERDLPIVLAGTKPILRERDPTRLYALACTQGWPGACGGWASSGIQ